MRADKMLPVAEVEPATITPSAPAGPPVLVTIPQVPALSEPETEHPELASAAGFAPAPSHDEIAREAYLLYAARGFQNGYDVEDWLAAEESLRQKRGRA